MGGMMGPATLLLAAAAAVGAAAVALARRRRAQRVRAFLAAHHPTRLRPGRRARKVLVISPTLPRANGTLVKQRRLMLPALNLAVLAALTPDDWDVEIVYEPIEEVPLDTDADLVAISGMGIGLWRGLQLADAFRARGKTVVVGGPQATLSPERVLEHADAVCVGDADEAWPRILRDFERGALERVYHGRHGPPLFPTPRYDLLVAKPIGRFLPVQVGRGCPHRCDFCSIAAAYGGEYHRREIPDVIRDVRAAISLGYRRVLLLDDNIAADPAYALRLFAEVERLGVEWMGQCALSIARMPELLAAAARSGCSTLSFGLESVNQESLDGVGKRFYQVEEYEAAIRAIRAAGIEVSTEMILGLDGDGEDTFGRTVDFVLRNSIALPRFYVLTPVEGTPLHARLRADGRIFDEDLGHYDAATVVFRPARMAPEVLQAGYWRVYDRVFTLRAILRRVFAGAVRRSVAWILFLLIVNLHYRRYVRRRICPGMV
jgi:radical SAM superfamily enzyme YgiQ (UPF0313 family)